MSPLHLPTRHQLACVSHRRSFPRAWRGARWPWARAVVGFAFSAACLYFAFRGVALEQTWRTVRSAAPLPLAAAVALAFGGLFARGLRWSRLLSPAGKGAWRTLGWSVAIGFAVNNLMPARVGELVRSVSAGRKLRIGASVAFGSVVVEKAWDIVGAVAVIAAGFLAVGSASGLDALAQEAGQRCGLEVSVPGLATSAAVAVGAVVAAVVLLALWPQAALRLGEWLAAPLPGRWRARLVEGLRGFGVGLARAARRDAAMILAISLGLWLATGASVWLALTACGVPAALPAVVLVVAALVIAVSLPNGPGFIGTYEYLAASAIAASTQVSWEHALATAIVLHLASYVPVTLAGITALLREGLSVGGAVRGVARLSEVNAPDPRPSEAPMDSFEDTIEPGWRRE